MPPRPALVDLTGGPMTGNGNGPMPLANPAATWSHLAGKRHTEAVVETPWTIRRESSSGREAVAAEEAGGTKVGDDAAEGPNFL